MQTVIYSTETVMYSTEYMIIPIMQRSTICKPLSHLQLRLLDWCHARPPAFGYPARRTAQLRRCHTPPVHTPLELSWHPHQRPPFEGRWPAGLTQSRIDGWIKFAVGMTKSCNTLQLNHLRDALPACDNMCVTGQPSPSVRNSPGHTLPGLARAIVWHQPYYLNHHHKHAKIK